MKLRITSLDKKINSTKMINVDYAKELDCEVRGTINMLHPVFTLTRIENYYQYNYCYVPLWSRYYFIKNIEIDGNLIYLHCDEDFLASWLLDLREQTFFCVRSSVKCNHELVDSLFPCPSKPHLTSYSKTNPLTTYSGGYYIIGIANGGNDSPKIGCNTYYLLSETEMTSFMDDIMSKLSDAEDWTDIADSMVKLMVDPLQYIKSCYYFACDITCPTESVSSIDFGWWSSDTSAKVLKIHDNVDTYTRYSISFEPTEKFFNMERDYLNYPPYSKCTINCFPFGEITVPDTLIKEHIEEDYPICIQVYVDPITGMSTLLLTDTPDLQDKEGYEAVPFYTQTCQFGVEIPLGEVLQDFMGSVLNTVGSVGSLVSGNFVGSAQGIQNALSSIAPSVNTTGEAGGFAQLMLEKMWTLKREYYEPEIYPDLMGEPLEQDVKFEDLHDGYAIFNNVDVTGTMLKEEKQEIKNLMETGIFVDLS